MEFCSGPWEGSTEDAYGNCDHYTGGIDGQGLYVTRNNDTYLHGRMRFENNIAFNNGFGGVVYHKTDRELVNNMVFMNGAYPGVTKYTGLTLNTADDVRIHNNILAREDGDLQSRITATRATWSRRITSSSARPNLAVRPITSSSPQATRHHSNFFTKVTGIASIIPDPDAISGPSSAAQIDDVLSSLNLDFEPLPTSWQVIDAGHPDDAPPSDRRGVTRPLGAGPDIGPFEVEADDTCGALGLNAGDACEDGLQSTPRRCLPRERSLSGWAYSCQVDVCVISAAPNGVDCDAVYDLEGEHCNDGTSIPSRTSVTDGADASV